MSGTRTARCACGRLSATVTGDPVRVSVCHCLECRRRTGSAFSWNARWAEADVVTEGASASFTRVGDEGSRITHHFCPECGVSVWYLNSDMPGWVAVPVGAFAALEFPAPGVSVYDDRRPDWLVLAADPLEIIN
jgi:hypothetical protein